MAAKLLRVVVITAMCVIAAVAYGIVHDLITAHICVEYFSIGHRRVIESQSPVALAMIWGVLATWWAGLILGLPLGVAAQVGRWPALNGRAVGLLVLRLLAVMGGAAALAGVVGYMLARGGIIHLTPRLAGRVPEERHVAFLSVGAGHLASYAVGFLGGVVLIFIVVFRRRRGLEAV